MMSLKIFSGSRRIPFAATACVLFMAACLLGAASAHAQIEIDLALTRHSYILYEPVLATVTITNNTGRDLTLQDNGGKQWFNMDVTRLDGTSLQPYDTDYKLHPLSIPSGQKVRRQIDLTPIFPIREVGSHRLRANIYFEEADKYFYSNYATFDLTDGKLLWRQTVGSPTDVGSTRQVSLLTHTLLDRMLLYVRVRDENGDNVYTTQSIGRVIMSGQAPEEVFDRDNVLHVLHEASPGSYLYTQVNLDGERLNQEVYLRVGPSRPRLVRNGVGRVEVHGGQRQATPEPGAPGATRAPKLSDRPVGLPKSPGSAEPQN